jgi:hypothetical protein
MPAETSIGIQKKTKADLEKIKVHPRETFDDIINRLLELHELHKKLSKEENHLFTDLEK